MTNVIGVIETRGLLIQAYLLILPDIPYSEHTEISNYPSELSHIYTWSKISDIVTLYLV